MLPQSSGGAGVNLAANDDPKSSTLALVERAGRSNVTLLYFDDALGREIVQAALAVPAVEIRLKDQAETELSTYTGSLLFHSTDGWAFDGRDSVPAEAQICVTPFFNPWMTSRYLDFDNNMNRRAIVIAPYIDCRMNPLDGSFLLTAYDVEYKFVVPLERLKQLKNVELKVSSGPDPPARQPLFP